MILENIPSTFTAKYSFILASYGGLYQGCSPCLAPQKAGFAPPRRNWQNLRGKADCKFQDENLIPLFIMHTNFISEEEKEGKASIWSYVQLVTLLKIEDAIFSFIKTPEGITNPPITNYVLLSNFWISGLTPWGVNLLQRLEDRHTQHIIHIYPKGINVYTGALFFIWGDPVYSSPL